MLHINIYINIHTNNHYLDLNWMKSLLVLAYHAIKHVYLIMNCLVNLVYNKVIKIGIYLEIRKSSISSFTDLQRVTKTSCPLSLYTLNLALGSNCCASL